MLAALFLLGSSLLPQPQRRPTPPQPPPPPPQDLTLPPEAASLITILEGRGVQVYTCTAEPAGFRWVFLAPEAQLFNVATGKPAGTHSAGPTWTLEDGVAVQGSPLFSRAGSTPSDVPWLLLHVQPASPSAPGAPPAPPQVAPSGPPPPPQISYVRRYNTHGGAPPPPAACNAAQAGTTSRVPYSANYAFYSAPGAPSIVNSVPATMPPMLTSPGPAIPVSTAPAQ